MSVCVDRIRPRPERSVDDRLEALEAVAHPPVAIPIGELFDRIAALE